MVGIGDLYGDFKTLCKQWFYEKSEVDTALNSKQNNLISGTNIKTINNTSLLGSGNITVSGGGSNVDISTSWGNPTSDTKVPSEKLVKDSLDDKQDELVSGTNLKTLNGVDLLGEGDIVIDVSCGDNSTISTVIFEDKGVTGDYSSDYTDLQSGITTTVGTTGTTLQASGYGDKFRRANALISGNFEAKYTCVNATEVYGSMRFMDSSNTNIFTVEQNVDEQAVAIAISGGTYTIYPIGEAISFPFIMTIRRVGTKLTVWYNDIQVATDLTVSDSDGYWAWKLYGNDGRQQTFKDFSIVEYSGSSISLSTNKRILSAYDSDTATLTATYQTGATMELWNANTRTKLGNFTENNGTYTYTYNSNGDGDINLIAKVGSEISDPLLIEDCLFYGINTNAFTTPSNTTFESDGEKITATTSTSGEKSVYFNHDFNQDDDFLFETELADVGQTQAVGMGWNDIIQYGGQYPSSNQAYVNLTGSDVRISHTFAIGDKYTVKKDNGTTSAYINETLISSAEPTYNSTFQIGFFINRNRTQYYKNIKIKLLNSVPPYSPNTGLQTENTIYLGDDIMTMIDTALGHMITNWENYE